MIMSCVKGAFAEKWKSGLSHRGVSLSECIPIRDLRQILVMDIYGNAVYRICLLWLIGTYGAPVYTIYSYREWRGAGPE